MQGLCKLVRHLPSGSDLKPEGIAQKLLDSWDAQNDENPVKAACVINVLTSWSYTCEVFTILIPTSAILLVIHEVYFGNRCKPLKISHTTLSICILSEGHFYESEIRTQILTHGQMSEDIQVHGDMGDSVLCISFAFVERNLSH